MRNDFKNKQNLETTEDNKTIKGMRSNSLNAKTGWKYFGRIIPDE